MRLRAFLEMTAAAVAGARGLAAPMSGDWMTRKWRVDPRCVLPQGAANEFDGSVVADPCAIWDDEVRTWRMFYFAGAGKEYAATRPAPTIGGMALSKSAEEIAPGDWRKAGPIPLPGAAGTSSGL